MILSSLLVRNFRMIEEAVLTLGPGIQLFLGANAQGKTSLIEAILFLSTSTSHRTRREEELIRWGSETAFLRGEAEEESVKERIECGLEKKRKSVKIDGAALPRIGDLYGHLRTVLFAPEDLEIVAGGPQMRRRFLDMSIAQIDREYIALLQKFRRTLEQRNAVLKRLQNDPHGSGMRELAVWDRPFLEYAAQIVHRRGETVRNLGPLAEEFYAGLADDGPLGLAYPPGEEANVEDIAKRMAERLERSRMAEIERGSSQIGPHRDDPALSLKGKNLAQFGSQGQKRTAALALRLAEARLCAAKTGRRPILLIDDVVYEMDNRRRARFWERIDLDGQLIVTATSREHLGAELIPAKIFQVNDGTICAD
ncbi:MAG: DNA replication/repair protein RecF [Candidatus Omnitrophota bacterium]